MDCFLDYILLEGVTIKVTPNSNMYLNKELTIPMSNINGSINSTQSSLETYWNDLQIKALRKFVVRLKVGMQELFKCYKLADDWYCDNLIELTIPWLYFLGSEMMTDIISHTDRVNRFTTLDIPKAVAKRDEFDSEFQIQLKSALSDINNKKTSPAPIGAPFKYIEVIP